MAVTICHASISENGNAGWDDKAKAGDQTGKEVCTRTWYNKPWGVMIRHKDAAIRQKAAIIAKKLANSNLVGYDQSERSTLYKALKKNNWDVDAYIASGVKTETDCSAFVYTCYACLVPSIRSDGNPPTTAVMKDRYTSFGCFEIHTESKYLTTDANLVIGDILVKPGAHTVMAITNGSNYTEPVAEAPKTQTTVKVPYIAKINTGALNIRQKASNTSIILGTYSNGQYVSVAKIDGDWGYVNNTGWINLKYTKKITSIAGTVIADGLNVRKDAGTSYAIITALTKGTAVKITKLNAAGTWGYDSKTKGWVSLKYIQLV